MIYQSYFVAVCDIPILNCPHGLNMNIKKKFSYYKLLQIYKTK